MDTTPLMVSSSAPNPHRALLVLLTAALVPLLLLLGPVPSVHGAIPAAKERAQLSAALNQTQLQPGQQAAIAVVLDIQPGFHAQSRTPTNEDFIRLDVRLDDSPAIKTLAPQYPAGHDEEYPGLGKLNVYTGRVIVYVPIEVSKDASVGLLRLTGQVTYQACDDRACYPPASPRFTLDTTIVPAGQPVQPASAELFTQFDPRSFAAGATPAASAALGVRIFGHDLTPDDYLLPFIAAFLVGIIFNVMPCVLPVVPLKAIGFYEVSQHHRGKSLALGAVFSAGIIATFAVLAILVVALRVLDWGQLFTYWWFLGGIIAILTVMALSMFGVFTVALPTSVYRFTPRHDTYLGNFLFGILTAILSTPCTFGMFLGLLVWAASQPAVLGVALVQMVGVGMAFPYLVLSAFPELARRFPRTGPWSALVKQMMGFLLLASAVYFARGFVESRLGVDLYWWTLFAVVAAGGVFLVVRTTQFAKTALGPIVATAIALAFVVPSFAVTWRIANPPIDWQPYTQAALDEARATGRPVLVEFTAAWCGNCLALEASTFHDPVTVEALKQHRVIALRADVTKPAAAGWDLLGQISPIKAIPLTAVYLPGTEAPHPLSGIYSPADLVDALTRYGTTPVVQADR